MGLRDVCHCEESRVFGTTWQSQSHLCHCEERSDAAIPNNLCHCEQSEAIPNSYKRFISTYKTNIFVALLLLISLFFLHATFEEIISDKNKQIDIFQKEIDELKNHTGKLSPESAYIQRQIDSVELSL